ncbi:2-keto-4-pentenoate hydratase [Rhodobium gokarnense]|uniref:2-keto-4-pentenoate hydratase n=1 Tax=Rhodobium gokarnense TaxID=364296 RepID=A0ABT3H7D9_9HYPH|nr:hypothetical protein [Rhodobium gokarnense]MCW2306313.1 2-keto-4-pentenoate hydratase [Rhodobium gokarnense]
MLPWESRHTQEVPAIACRPIRNSQGSFDMDQRRIGDCANLLRRAPSCGKLAALPADLAPRNEAEAYAVQLAVLGDRPVGGWKVGAIHAPGPFVASVLPPALPDARLPSTLTAPEVEVEVAVLLRADLPLGDEPWTADTIGEALGPACTAIEILDSRFESRTAAAPLSALADLGSSGAVRLGAPFAGWQELDLTAQPVTLEIDGETHRAQGNATLEQTRMALAWLANHAASRGVALSKGQFVITGARLGPFQVTPGQTVTARFGPMPEIDLMC